MKKNIFKLLVIILLLVIGTILAWSSFFSTSKENKDNQSLLKTEIERKTDESNIFKGNVDNNYVWYSGFLWRIMYLSDKDIRLVTDDAVTTVMAGTESSGYQDLEFVRWLNQDFKKKLKDPMKIVLSNNTFMVNNPKKGMEYYDIKLDIGTITKKDYDQSMLNHQTYLNQKSSYALLALNQINIPKGNALLYAEYQDVHQFTSDRTVVRTYFLGTAMHIRPEIAIDLKTKIYGGSGTYEDPYLLDNRDKGNLLNEQAIGDYVQFSGMLFRINDITADKTTRLVLAQDDCYIESVFDKSGNTKFDSSSEDNIAYYLNHNFYDLLEKNKMVEAEFDDNPYDVNYGVGEQSSTVRANVGMIGYGDLFASQSHNNHHPLWLINSINNKQLLISNGMIYYVNAESDSYTFAKSVVKPVIEITSSIKISKGDGTKDNPYII